MLENMRVLVAFLRNKSWRQFLAKALVPKGYEPMLFEHFAASIVKRRYETIPVCQRELLKWRKVLEGALREGFFANTQDRPFSSRA